MRLVAKNGSRFMRSLYGFLASLIVCSAIGSPVASGGQKAKPVPVSYVYIVHTIPEVIALDEMFEAWGLEEAMSADEVTKMLDRDYREAALQKHLRMLELSGKKLSPDEQKKYKAMLKVPPFDVKITTSEIPPESVKPITRQLTENIDRLFRAVLAIEWTQSKNPDEVKRMRETQEMQEKAFGKVQDQLVPLKSLAQKVLRSWYDVLPGEKKSQHQGAYNQALGRIDTIFSGKAVGVKDKTGMGIDICNLLTKLAGLCDELFQTFFAK